MMTTISTAASQYANRPKDESYADLPSLIAAKRDEREHSKEIGYNLRDLQAVATDDGLRLASPKGTAVMSHWSFGQLARMVGAPAGYLRTLPAAVTADALNYGIQHQAPVGQTASLLVRRPNGTPEPAIRSITTDTYSRLWDDQLYSSVQSVVFNHTSNGTGGAWIAPPTWEGDAAGTWAGDRDSFVIRVDGGSIVNDPSCGSDGRLYRGIMIRNSEVGAAAVSFERVLFQYICGNLNLWGAVIDKQYRRRHVGNHVMRDVMREIGQLAYDWTTRPASADEAIIKSLIDHELASTPEGVADELKAIGYSKAEAEAAVQTCEQHFKASPRSYWGIAQGTTKLSQSAAWQSDRLPLDLLAAKVLQRGARVTA